MTGVIAADTAGQALSIVLSMGVRELSAANIPDPQREARILLAYAADIPTDRVVMLGVEDFTRDIIDRYLAVVNRRRKYEPISHITGRRAFYNHEFKVTSAVLDPRPETEILVNEALKGSFSNVLDLGTGSGCILLSLLAERPGATGLGVDLSGAALEVADYNAAALGLSDRVEFRQSDWFEHVGGKFDLIVSNPPYISAAAYQTLAPDVAKWEPKLALTPGGDGLGAYRIIAGQAKGHLNTNGIILVEIGYDQGAAVCQIFQLAGFGETTIIPDLDGRDRVVCAR